MTSISDESIEGMAGSQKEIAILARYIMDEIPGEPSRNEGAGECAVRLLKKYRAALAEIFTEAGVIDECRTLGVPDMFLPE